MREKKTFGERTHSKTRKEPRKKVLLIFEGEKTEALYFEAVKAYREKLHINELVDLIPIEREYHEKGTSNPKKMLNLFLESVNFPQETDISRDKLLGWIMDELIDKCDFLKTEKVKNCIWRILRQTAQEIWGDDYSEKLRKTVIEDTCKKIIDSLVSKLEHQFSWPSIVKRIGADIESNHQTTYDPKLDRVCFIIDRDKQSFKEEQYKETLKLCREYGYGFYLSNPCFEFWLLLHFPKSKYLTDQEKRFLLENKKHDGIRKTRDRTYAVNKLREVLPNYDKNKYNAEALMKQLPIAIVNEEMFCENEDLLMNELGSRVGILLRELRS